MNNIQKIFYLSKFKGKVFVLKIGGEVIQSKTILKDILKDIREILELGIRVILVHGGGPQADCLAKKLGIQSVKIEGRRITGKEDLEIVKMLYGGSLNLEILSIMKQLGMKGIRVSGLDGDLLDVRKREVKAIDYGYVGEINKVNPKVLFDFLEKQYLPIVSPLAVDSQGTILNVNADTIATEIAITLKAEKLILFTNTDGVTQEGHLISVLTPKEGKTLIQQGVISGGMAVKVSNALKAIEGGVKRVHILNGLSPQSLLHEVLTHEGVGTMVVASHERQNYTQESGIGRLPSYTYCFKGKKPGPIAVIVGSAHGNEPIGAQVIGLLRKRLSEENIHGIVYLIIGNPKACAAGKRYIDCDLNRQFGDSLKTRSILPRRGAFRLTYEEKRALELAPILVQADFALDIHSTLKPSIPFLFFENTPAHLRLASVFETEIIVSPSSDLPKNTCIDNFVDAHGGIGITYESGWNQEKGDKKEVFHKALRFLKIIGAVSGRAMINHGPKPRHLIVYAKWSAKTDHFRFMSDYANFDCFKKGDVIARDGAGIRRAMKDSFILFPKKEIKKRGVACCLAYVQN
ncbi:acetylglutamate kinase [Candidatus Peregrinibacteria bacterium]|nr:acetylglutamate kinase [Candidatus Peregrinibacteria bacterium]